MTEQATLPNPSGALETLEREATRFYALMHAGGIRDEALEGALAEARRTLGTEPDQEEA